ncbi:hypothetical protein P153DRAFT_395107 [Dothidotthia symphoricarpi CBS 119687]|uniref:F-box domain-containing protein n=1 Tax=Dothidotthia symphoricarpi CBS 119687 TaxID=1392245 RepID=A0A6A6AJS0_9PLEO|nr:uncharacterized protein P153DRAFT_395107 [Dothidotthia symphoricarpi CBS 119687]KAF2131806.1 hypothetical protein P153DRAFT_395107 [Dothidotthia symphoricarpi CBS 119687]
MPTLIDIPVELLEDALSPLSISDLYSLSRTCKALRRYLSPRIYHTIDWSWTDGQPCPPYGLLLRTLLGHAALASYIKVIRLRGGGIINSTGLQESSCDEYYSSDELFKPSRSIWSDGRQVKSVFGPTSMRKVGNLISTIASTDAPEHEWKKEFERGNIDVITKDFHSRPRLSKALAHVKNTLESLVLKVRFECDMWREIKDPWGDYHLCGLVGRVTGINEMPKLTNLEVSWALLLGWNPYLGRGRAGDDSHSNLPKSFMHDADIGQFPWSTILPPSIETVCFRDDLSDFTHYTFERSSVINLVEHLLKSRDDHFEALVRVDFFCIWNRRCHCVTWSKAEMMELLDVCERASVKCEIFQEQRVEGTADMVDVKVLETLPDS